ncbi:myosin light chain kinase, smooth muscle-like [Anneissia japonica]|uniref:myosin light chain kinase, smooth muscle-like n=1 Tax=Anneissia japonica TaxID=1529436 RepID=UPI001425A951|nr:myosin light chain kinase, smooth muscle-like [Anneissia japonica]
MRGYAPYQDSSVSQEIHFLSMENILTYSCLKTKNQIFEPSEIPEPPAAKPYAAKVTKDSINLVWPGTTYDGGAAVTGYHVEMAPAGTNSWKTVTKDVFSTSYSIKSLKENDKLIFRVSCLNSVGSSKPSEVSEPIVVADTEDEMAFQPRQIEFKTTNVKQFYDIKDELGRGKFGTVNRCVEKSSKRTFAAKFIKAEKPADKKEVEHEIDIMKKLQHPKLLQLYDCFGSGNNMVIILEIVSGGELFERVIDEEFDLTEKDCVMFMTQICEGMQFMHEKKIIHLDMKPENILCVRKNSNKIKIIDFGLAQEYTDGLKVSCGTPEFLAPEVVSFDPVNTNTDMWSVGVIAYVLLSGLSPFMGDTEGETMTNILKVEWDWDDECFDDISDASKNFIECLLQKDQDKRNSAAQCLKHDWLIKAGAASSKAISKAKLKKYVIRRRWQKAINAVRAMIRVKSIV